MRAPRRRSGCTSTSSSWNSPECYGGEVVAAPDRDLGLRVQHRARGGELTLIVVRGQQAGRRPALDVGRQLPAEVDAVQEAGAECHARRRKQVGGVARQQKPPVAVPLDLPSVEVKRVSRVGSPKGRSTPSTRRMLSRSSVTVIGSSSSYSVDSSSLV